MAVNRKEKEYWVVYRFRDYSDMYLEPRQGNCEASVFKDFMEDKKFNRDADLAEVWVIASAGATHWRWGLVKAEGEAA